MYHDTRDKNKCKGDAHTASSFAIELTRSSAEIEDFEIRHEAFLQNVTESDEEGPTVVATIRSIAKEHQRIVKRDFSETSHYKRFKPTNDIKCLNVRDDQISKFPNGDTYDGQFLNIVSSSSIAFDQHQEGPSSSSSSFSSSGAGGETQALLKHGSGKYKYFNGDQYEGDWSYDKW